MIPERHYVVIHRSPGPPPNSPAALAAIAQTRKFDLTSDIWIQRLSLELGTAIINACDPRHNHVGPPPFVDHLYAFVRRVPATEKPKYEGMTELLVAVALSRLVQPTRSTRRLSAASADA